MKKASIFILLMLSGILVFSASVMANCDHGFNNEITMHYEYMDLNYESGAALPAAIPHADCTITVKGVYNGAAVDMTFTVHGMSCPELIKKLMTK